VLDCIEYLLLISKFYGSVCNAANKVRISNQVLIFSSIPINLEIRDPDDRNVIWSSIISSDGVASGSFTPTVTAEYLVTLSAFNTKEEAIEFTIDNFYAYVAPPSPTDFVSLFLPDVLAYNDYYPFGMLVPNRHASSTAYRYGYNGMEKDEEFKGEGNSYDFGARLFDPRIGRWFAKDPNAKDYPYMSTYAYSLNSPIYTKDPNGKWAVSVHYKLTYKAALKLGFSKKEADRMAHYASVYADHPSKTILFVDNIMHFTWNSYKKVGSTGNLAVGEFYPNYNNTAGSQDEKNSHFHSMMSDSEALSGKGHYDAMVRGLKFGWDNIFSQEYIKDEGKRGQGFHALQDAMAHKGAATNEHLGKNISSVKMMYNDMYGDTEMAKKISETSMVVYGVITNRFTKVGMSNLNGKDLYLPGVTKEQIKRLENKLDKKGYSLQLAPNGLGGPEDFDTYRIVKKATK
jgi:RHS repeat-associated protein